MKTYLTRLVIMLCYISLWLCTRVHWDHNYLEEIWELKTTIKDIARIAGVNPLHGFAKFKQPFHHFS